MENTELTNNEEFRKLPNAFKVHGIEMKLVERNDKENYAVYNTDDLGMLYYEVFQIKVAKATTFYKHFSFEGATSHIDDKYGIDVDDIYNVNDILAPIFNFHLMNFFPPIFLTYIMLTFLFIHLA